MTKISNGSRGRPRGARNTTSILMQILAEKHTVTDQDGKRRRRTTLELLLERLRNKAIALSPQATRLVEQLLQVDSVAVKAGFLVVPEKLTPEEWISRKEAMDRVKKAGR